MAQMQAGSPQALGQLFDRYYTRVYRIALVICGNRELAEDAVQNAFVSIWTGRGGFLAQRGTVAAWLLASVRYRAIDLTRHRARRVAPLSGGDELDALEASEDTAAQVASGIEAERVRALLARLPGAQREVITLAFYGGLTHAEIAAHLNLPSGTVKGRMRLGLRKLRDSLEADGELGRNGVPAPGSGAGGRPVSRRPIRGADQTASPPFADPGA